MGSDPGVMQTPEEETVKLKRNMSIPDMVKALAPELKKALPSAITPERFTRIALSALNNTPQLQQCTPMSFIAALLNAAQLGLEVNTPLGLAYLIPYKNKGQLECQFQIGYKGLITLAYRNGNMQTIQAQTVYENDEFEFEYSVSRRTISSKSVMSLRPLTCHIPVIPGLIAILARWCSSYCSSSSGRIGRVPTRLMEPPYVKSGTTLWHKKRAFDFSKTLFKTILFI